MPQARRPIPADFAENRDRMTYAQLCRHYGAGKPTIGRWIDDLGLDRRSKKRPIPADFAERCAQSAFVELVSHYRTHYNVIRRWLRETGLTPGQVKDRMRPVPADWAQMAPTMLNVQLRKHYGCSGRMVNAWAERSGVHPKQVQRIEKPAKAPKPVSVSGPGLGFKNQWGNLARMRASSLYDDAADIIRAKCPVYRCTEKGAYDPKGKFWRVGWSVLTGDELLERAERQKARAA